MQRENFVARLARNHPRLFAGIWFSLPAWIPVLFTLDLLGLPPVTSIYFWRSTQSVVIMVVVPILIAALFGSLLGHSILDPRKTITSWDSCMRGLLVGFSSFFVFTLIFALLAGRGNFLFVVGYALILVGWLIAILAPLSGWLLYYLFRTYARV